MTHLNREELEPWWQDGQPDQRERIAGHLARCDECGRWEVVAVGPGGEEIMRASPRAFSVSQGSR